MLYLVYERYKQDYHRALDALKAVLDEQEVLIASTEPSAVRYDGDRVQHSSETRIGEYYAIRMETSGLDQRISAAKKLAAERGDLLRMKLVELRQSHDVEDRIYVARFVDRRGVRWIERSLNYSERAVYYHIREIVRNIRAM